MMKTPFNFKCAYCKQTTTIIDTNYSSVESMIETSMSNLGDIRIYHQTIACPNPDCREITLNISLETVFDNLGYGRYEKSGTVQSWQLLPESSAKPMPSYIPDAIIKDYQEACKIAKLSPKASASLARRCLQGIIRDYWEIPMNKRGNLGAEINYISDKITPELYEVITRIRSIGDIGAHMEKDVNLIIDVEPEEADLLISLMESLFEEWYIARHHRQTRAAELGRIVQSKRAIQRTGKNKANGNDEDSSLSEG
jgi:hypothetical protein